MKRTKSDPIQDSDSISFRGHIDVGDRCWKPNVLVTNLRCWWPILTLIVSKIMIFSSTSWTFYHYEVTNITMSPTSLPSFQKLRIGFLGCWDKFLFKCPYFAVRIAPFKRPNRPTFWSKVNDILFEKIHKHTTKRTKYI